MGEPPTSDLPIGTEMLLNKAAADAAFRALLLDDPIAAAESIHLALAPEERAMLRSMPREQLSGHVDHVRLSPEDQQSFHRMTDVNEVGGRMQRERLQARIIPVERIAVTGIRPSIPILPGVRVPLPLLIVLGMVALLAYALYALIR